MRYCLLITCPPHSDNALNALRFAEALVDSNHHIERIFFYGDGVWLANANATPAQDLMNVEQAWSQFIDQHKLDSIVCIAAALRRGVLDQSECERYGKPGANLHSAHTLSGLGQLAEATQKCDRLVSFK